MGIHGWWNLDIETELCRTTKMIGVPLFWPSTRTQTYLPVLFFRHWDSRLDLSTMACMLRSSW